MSLLNLIFACAWPSRILSSRVLGTHRIAILLVIVAALPDLSAAQTTQPANSDVKTSPSLAPSQAQVALAEGVYSDEYLGNCRRALEFYRRARDEGDLSQAERCLLRLRMARCFHHLNQPEPARRALLELLRETTIAAGLREDAERLLRALPAPSPARLMPADTFVYGESSDLVSLLAQLPGLLRASSSIKPPEISDELLEELRHVEAIGIGWYGFRENQRQDSGGSELVILLFTDGSAECNKAVFTLAGLTLGESRLDPIERAPPSSASHSAPPGRFWFASDEDLFLLCTDSTAGALAIGLHRGELANEENPAAVALRNAAPATDGGANIFVDWRAIFGSDATDTTPAGERELWTEFGATVGNLKISAENLRLDATTTLSPDRSSLYSIFKSSPRTGDWPTWQTEDSVFELVTSVSSGADRWRDFVKRVLAPEGRDKPQWLADLESSLGIDVAADVFDPITDLAVYRLVSKETRTERGGPWLLAVHVTDSAQWMAAMDRCLRQLLLASLEDAELPLSTIETPIGTVRVLSPTRGLAGIAWIVDGNDIFIAPSPDVLVDFLSHRTQRPPTTTENGERESKRITIDVARLMPVHPANPRRAARNTAPMTISLYEHEDSIRVVLEQPRFADVFPNYLNWIRETLKPIEKRPNE